MPTIVAPSLARSVARASARQTADLSVGSPERRAPRTAQGCLCEEWLGDTRAGAGSRLTSWHAGGPRPPPPGRHRLVAHAWARAPRSLVTANLVFFCSARLARPQISGIYPGAIYFGRSAQISKKISGISWPGPTASWRPHRTHTRQEARLLHWACVRHASWQRPLSSLTLAQVALPRRRGPKPGGVISEGEMSHPEYFIYSRRMRCCGASINV